MLSLIGNTKIINVLPVLWIMMLPLAVAAQSNAIRVRGSVLDSVGLPVAGAHMEFDSPSGARISTITKKDGGFGLSLLMVGFTFAYGSVSLLIMLFRLLKGCLDVRKSLDCSSDGR